MAELNRDLEAFKRETDAGLRREVEAEFHRKSRLALDLRKEMEAIPVRGVAGCLHWIGGARKSRNWRSHWPTPTRSSPAGLTASWSA